MDRQRDQVALVRASPELADRVAVAAEAAGFTVRTAPDETARAQEPDALVVEMGTDAWTVASAASGRPRRSVLVALGCSGSADVSRALREGAAVAVRAEAAGDELTAILRLVGDLARSGAALEAARAELDRHSELVMRDDLTAAYNRRFFERCMDDEIDRARRFDSCVALIFMDIDDLRDVNHRHGHAMGSKVLVEAARRTIDTVRSIDKVVRYGGDEFCIVLPETDWKGAREVAERVMTAFASAPFAVDGASVALTASFGVASFPIHGKDKTELVKAADEAMFSVKEERKNGILVAGGSTA